MTQGTRRSVNRGHLTSVFSGQLTSVLTRAGGDAVQGGGEPGEAGGIVVDVDQTLERVADLEQGATTMEGCVQAVIAGPPGQGSLRLIQPASGEKARRAA